MTGIPVSRDTRIKPLETLSDMYSKCIVSPLISTPIAMMASKGPVETVVAATVVRSLVEPPSRSPAELPTPAEEDWTWDAA